MAGYYPDAVTLHSITLYTNRTFKLTWNFNALYDQPVTHIYIYRSTIAGALGTLYVTLTTPIAVTYIDNSPSSLGIQYYYTIIIRTPVGLSNNSNQQGARVLEMPGIPSITNIVREQHQNLIYWEHSGTGGSSYLISYIYYGSSRDALNNFNVNIDNPYVHDGISSSNPYYYKIVIQNEIGWTTESIIRCSITLQPTGLIAQSKNFSITLSWTAPYRDESVFEYRIYRSNSTHSEFLLATIGNITTYTDSLYYPGTHIYRVVAVGFAGASDYSSPVTESPNTWPGKITTITPTYFQRAMTLDWDVPEDGNYPITRYYLYYETSPGNFEIIFDNSNPTCYLYNMTVNTSYSFYIRAENALGQGIPSDIFTVYACDLPTAVTG